jgi:hypothetical protein
VFYIGISSKNDINYERAYSISGRNDIWKSIVKDSGYEVVILKKYISLNKAKLIERDLIKLYGRIDNKTGILSNKSNGGEGTPNIGPIYVCDSTGKLLGTYKSIEKAAKKFNPKYIL